MSIEPTPEEVQLLADIEAVLLTRSERKGWYIDLGVDKGTWSKMWDGKRPISLLAFIRMCRQMPQPSAPLAPIAAALRADVTAWDHVPVHLSSGRLLAEAGRELAEASAQNAEHREAGSEGGERRTADEIRRELRSVLEAKERTALAERRLYDELAEAERTGPQQRLGLVSGGRS